LRVKDYACRITLAYLFGEKVELLSNKDMINLFSDTKIKHTDLQSIINYRNDIKTNISFIAVFILL
jgi:hypothetical protein